MLRIHDRVLWATVKVYGVMSQARCCLTPANISRAQSGDRPPAAMKQFMDFPLNYNSLESMF